MRVIVLQIWIWDIGDRPLWGWSAAAWHFSDIAQWRSSRMSAFVVETTVFVCVCWELEKGWGRWGLKKQRGLLLGLSPVPCLLAVNLISKEKYTLCLYNAGLCLRSASEPSTILQIVSSLLKCFQTVTVEPVRLPVNCLASFPNPGLSWASSEERRLSDYGAAAGVVASSRGAGRLSCHTTETRVRHGRFLYITASSPPHLFIALPPLWTVKIVR